MNDQGVAVYLSDPGINGIHRTRPDGSAVTKYDAPKATLMSYIIKGILNRQLPWGLVLLGVSYVYQRVRPEGISEGTR